MKLISAGSLIALLLTTAACGGDPAPEPEPETRQEETEPVAVPWKEVVAVTEAQEGEYEKTWDVTGGGHSATMMTEWVTFDLNKKVIDRRVALGAEFQENQAPEATRDEPTLRFLYTADRFLMWNPGVEGACGTSWVNMPPEAIEETTGLTFDPSDVFAVEPLDIIASADAPAEPESVTEQETAYAITLPGGTGIRMSSFLADKPKVARELEQQELSGEVRVGHGDAPLESSVDLTDALEAVQPGSAAQATATVTWHVTAPADVPEPDLPSNVAEFSCMN